MKDDRLQAQDWVNAGLKALAKSGAAALKADPLAKALGVSRGSFYWHFADVDAFQFAVLERWRTVAYENIVAAIEESAADRLEALLARAFGADTRLERAVRAWATAAPKARAMVEAVDGKRLQYLQRLLQDAGLDAEAAATRARIVNWIYLGHVLAAGRLAPAEWRRTLADLAILARTKG